MREGIAGQLSSAGRRLCVVVSRFNSMVTEGLLRGARDAISRTGGDLEKLKIYRTAGSFEIPLVIKRIVDSEVVEGVVALGALIRGSTPHFEYISAEVIRGLSEIQLRSNVPISYGIITADTMEQAIERSGAKAGNRGFDAALALIETIDLLRRIDAENR